MKRLLTFLILTCLLASSALWAQVSGDYRSAVNGGNWSTVGTWEKFDGTSWATATAAPSATNNVTIRNGYDVILDGSGKNCKNLYVENPIVIPDVFFSEYIEGSSNNKAIEIYNGTNAPVDLSQFTVKQANNGFGWGSTSAGADTRYALPLTGTLAAGDVYVITNDQANAAIKAVADLVLTYNNTANGAVGSNVASFNGDDAMGLFFNDVLIDVIGVPTVDPGTNWPVAGGVGATSEFTLVRKTAVKTGNIDWGLSSGTNTTDSEWEVYPQNTFNYLGEHPTVTIKPTFTTCTIDKSDDKIAWTVLPGTLSSGFNMTLDPSVAFYYMNFSAATATNVKIKEGYYGFTITSYPTGFFEYWAGRGVDASAAAGTWQAEAWKIINGNLPTFYVKADTGGNLTLVDGLVKAIAQPDEFLRIEGSYLLGAYSYAGKLTSVNNIASDTIKVNITFEAPRYITFIAAIQDTTGKVVETPGDSPLKGQRVKTTGIVTGVASNAYYLQDAPGAWNGVYVYTNTAPGVLVGDSVVVEGRMAEYYNLTEIDSAITTVIEHNRPLPEPVVVTANELKQEKYEGVLVKIMNVTCTNPSLGSGEWEITDASGVTRVDDQLFVSVGKLNWVYNITGVTNYTYSNYKIEPRSAADIEVVSQPTSRFLWEKDISSYPFFKNDHNTRGMAYNPATNHLLVASRTGGAFVWILNAANGDTVGRLDMTGVTGGTFLINIPRVTADGVIYVCNLSTGATAPFKIYRWENEAAVPTVAAEIAAPTLRIGDAFALAGNGVNTVLYASGSNSTQISVFNTVDGVAFTAGTPIPVATGLARGGIAPAEDGSFWVNGAGTATSHIDANGALIAAVDGGLIDGGWHNVGYLNYPFTKKMIAIVGKNNAFRGNQVQVWNISESETTPVLVDTVNLTSGYNANTNACGDLAFRKNVDGTITVFELITNNGIAAWNLTPPIHIPLLTIAEAKADGDGNFRPDLENKRVAVRGVITTTDFESLNPAFWNVFIQDTTGGLNIYSSKFKGPITIGDEIELHGILTFYRGLTEIIPDSLSHVKVLSHGNLVPPRKVKLADIGEETESILVQVDSIWFVQPTTWPAPANNANLQVTDGIDTVTFRIDKDSDVDDWADWPRGIFGVIAVGNQYTAKVPPNDGYQIQGIAKDLFYLYPEPFKPEPLVPFWAKTQATMNFPAYMSTGNYTRGMAYGKVEGNDRVYVVTRSGAHRIVVYDAMTGDSLKEIPAPPNPVGTFPVNAVDVSDDGRIYVCNMTLDASTTAFTVYQYLNENATPVPVISYTGLNKRFGDMFSVYGSAADNSLTIYAAAPSSDKIVKFSTADHGATFTPTEITLSRTMGSLPNVAPDADGSLWIKSAGKPLMHLGIDGTTLDTVSTEIVGTSSSKIKYFDDGVKKCLLVYYYNFATDAGMEKFHVIDVTEGPAKAKLVRFSHSIGNVANLNGTGSVDVMPIDEHTWVAFIMGTNNGLAAFTNAKDLLPPNVKVKFYGTTPNVLNNPYGAGYICGSNAYGDLGKYQRFDLNANNFNFLYGFMLQFGVMNIVDEPDTLDLVVKGIGAQGVPGELLFSIKVPTSQIDTALLGIHNVFRLPSPIPVPPHFFVGFEWPATANDQFAMLSDKNGEGDGQNRVWERFADGGYNDFGTVLNPSYSWGIDIDLWISAFYIQGPEVSIKSQTDVLPTRYALHQNYPNPFNPTTNILLALPEPADVKLVVYNMIGQEVATIHRGHLPAGNHVFNFSSANLASGIYFYKVQANNFTALKKMTILK